MNCYYEILSKSVLTQELIDIANDSDPWVSYYYFNLKLVPREFLPKDPFLKWLASEYEFNIGILKLDPYVCYDWHTDSRRGVSINMLLTIEARSTCVFSKHKQGVVFSIEELIYKPDTYYAFNTQIPHTVYNFETTRYLLSIEFIKDSANLSFNHIMEDIDKNYRLT
jgi:hypothetical protein